MNTLPNLISLLAAYACVPPDSIGFTDSLADIGLDSLDYAQLILDVEECFKIEIPAEDAAHLTTIAALHDAILRAQGLTL